MKQITTILFVLLVAGLMFSGYLSAVKLFSDTCAFNESCPYFLGYPACWYGFAMYLAMFVIAIASIKGKMPRRDIFTINSIIAFAGVIFAGRFFVQELMDSSATGVLGLSTCAYGFIFYVLILGTTLLGRRKLSQLPQ